MYYKSGVFLDVFHTAELVCIKQTEKTISASRDLIACSGSDESRLNIFKTIYKSGHTPATICFQSSVTDNNFSIENSYLLMTLKNEAACDLFTKYFLFHRNVYRRKTVHEMQLFNRRIQQKDTTEGKVNLWFFIASSFYVIDWNIFS